MVSGTALDLPFWFAFFPGAVLNLTEAGQVIQSNGRLDDELGQSLTGRTFADFLDTASSGRKWDRILQLSGDDEARDGDEWELVLAGTRTLDAPRCFVIVRDAERGELWMFEQRSDRRLEQLQERLLDINSELAQTQRELVKERAELSATLTDLASQHTVGERLTRTVQDQNADLLKINEALDDFVQIVSHDLKAPLRGIAQYAGWLRSDIADLLPAESLGHLQRLDDLTGRLRSMIDGALQFARAGRRDVDQTELDLEELFDDVLMILDPDDRITIRRDLRVASITTSRVPLRQVLLNLLSNALHYAGANGPPAVTVSATMRGGDFVEFSVSDNGPGIPVEHRERIWRLFHTLEPEDSAHSTGVGLALVQKEVDGRGGRVWVESEVGSGSTFAFLWPIEHPDQAGDGRSAANRSAEPADGSEEPHG